MARFSYLTIVVFSILVFSTLGCALLTTPAPAPTPAPAATLTSIAAPLPTSTSTSIPTAIPPTQPPAPEVPTPTPTAEIVDPATEIAPVLSAPQPAAPAHFKPGDPVRLDMIAMKTRTDGWGISGGTVLTTSDGGQTWHEATPPVTSPPGTTNQAYGTFLDAKTAWIIFAGDGLIPPEASVWHTTDRGLNWTPGLPLNHQAIGDRVWAEFAVLDAQNIWLMVRGVYVGAGTHYNHELFHSPDGGLTWIPLPGDRSDDYTGMVFTDPNAGLRTLQTTGAYAAAPPAYEITMDGGAAWETRELPPPTGTPDLFTRYPYCETYQPVVLSPGSIRMLVGCFDYGDPPKKFISYFYSSTDGGANWQIVPLPAKVQASQDTLIYFGLNNALLLGRDTYISTSDGQTWSFVKNINWDGQFSFSDTQYGWAVARSNGEVALVQTINGAVTWKIVKPTIAQ